MVMVCNVSSAVAMLKGVDNTGLGMVVRAGAPALVMVEGSLIEGRTGLVGGFNNRLVDWVVVSYSSEYCISSCATSRGSHIWFVAAKRLLLPEGHSPSSPDMSSAESHQSTSLSDSRSIPRAVSLENITVLRLYSLQVRNYSCKWYCYHSVTLRRYTKYL